MYVHVANIEPLIFKKKFGIQKKDSVDFHFCRK